MSPLISSSSVDCIYSHQQQHNTYFLIEVAVLSGAQSVGKAATAAVIVAIPSTTTTAAPAEHAQRLDEGEEDQGADAHADDDPLLLVVGEAGAEADAVQGVV